MRWQTQSLLGVAVAAVAAVAGCCCDQPNSKQCGLDPECPTPSQAVPESFLTAGKPQEVPEARVVRRDYRLRPGDSLEIIYHIRHQRNVYYRIKIEDVIQLRFPFHPGLNQTETVQSDGFLNLDLVGRVFVLDKTIDQLQSELEKMYGKYLKKAHLTVSFQASNVKIRELKDAIRTAPRGQSRLVPIAPDGRISLPFIADTLAAGLTIDELHRSLTEAYEELGLDELEVTVNIQNVGATQVYVLGEVRIPGTLLNRTGALAAAGQLTLLQALAQAGGYIPGRAELSKVALIRRKNLPRPQMAIINVFQLLEKRKRQADATYVPDSDLYRYDIWLEDGDVVYVPTTDIALRADYIDLVWTRGIRAVGGFSSSASASYTAGDSVDWLGPDP